jgi:hypothetical protein
MGASHGITANTPKRLVFGAGVWIRNYDVTKTPAENVAIGTSIMGATNGGNEIEIVTTLVYPKIDGALGKIKGTARIIEDTMKCKGTFAEMDLDTLLDLIPGSTQTALASGIVKVTRATDVQAADYLTSIALVCDHAQADGSIGFVLLNPLQQEPVVIAPVDKDFATLGMAMEAHYDPAAMATRPWQMLFPGDLVVS